MEVFVARQPILTRKLEVFAYELLYRQNKQQNHISNLNHDYATSEVINSFLQIGIDVLSEGKPCFINFSEKLLEGTFPTFLHPELTVIEVLETVRPTKKVIENCLKLKSEGYKIALDDFELRNENENYNRLIDLADIVKIDVRLSNREEQLRIMKALEGRNIEFLAEKVETREEYEQCLEDGFAYFQGYFFSKPTILSTNDIPVLNHNLYVIITELSKGEPDIESISRIIESDISLSIKLLRLLNSPAIGLVNKIKSIKQAIVLLGLVELKKWIYVLSLREHLERTDHLADEVIKLSLTRAKASELVAINIGKQSECSSYFLTGLLSLVETIYRQPKEHIISKLPLDQEIKDTLQSRETSLLPVYKLICAVESGEWEVMEEVLSHYGLRVDTFNELYKQALRWAKEVVEGVTVQDI
ncbi:EAL and HDOD domain-containing protein [Ornithinibacillus scapharcae]|uniref:EAL and HDOD domain-containing protein n=1 Tax=Ornithinibacillus scapharcae TaxID=1147159 RepID=UPI000225B8E9|nr:HDOD domain-containing protein [Ornithinibacillus scapharcae]